MGTVAAYLDGPRRAELLSPGTEFHYFTGDPLLDKKTLRRVLAELIQATRTVEDIR